MAEESSTDQIDVDKDGNIYFVDTRKITINKLSTDGTVTIVAGGGTANNLLVPFILPDTPLTATEVNMGLASNVKVDILGNIYTQIGKNIWNGSTIRFFHRTSF